ncbi:hypothetical protein [Pseudomonas sp. PMCC200344]|uniref:hypothetical protein n=1 Tax=Pseudomonas sp. PMCC200344 TaxID=3042028 RepID=UPI0032C49325
MASRADYTQQYEDFANEPCSPRTKVFTFIFRDVVLTLNLETSPQRKLVFSRPQNIAELKALTAENLTITVSGDVALVLHHFSAQALKGTEVVPTEIENFQIWQKQKGHGLLVGRQAFKF